MAVPSQKIERQRKRESFSCWTGEEIEVAEILVELKPLFMESKPRKILSWGAKRRRSALDEEDPSLYSSPSRPVVPPLVSCVSEKTHIKAEASSPATPLAFSPSDVERPKSKPLSRRQAFRKKKNKELKEMEAVLVVQREQLRHEVEKVAAYYNKLKFENLELKRRQLELGGLSQRIDQIDLNGSRVLYNVEDPTPETPTYPDEEQNGPTNHLPSIAQPGPSTSTNQNYSQNACFGENYRVPDLNFCAEESSPDTRFLFHVNKAALAAQARKRRAEINKGKRAAAKMTWG